MHGVLEGEHLKVFEFMVGETENLTFARVDILTEGQSQKFGSD